MSTNSNYLDEKGESSESSQSSQSSESHILDEAKEIVYERPDKHGKPEDCFQTIAELWNGYLRGGGIVDPNIRPEDVADMMMLLKIARNSQGEYVEDNYSDIAGYAECGARLNEDN